MTKENIYSLIELSDIELISRFKTTLDKNFVGVLFKRYTKFVFLISMKYLKDEDASKDAVMQIFEKLFTNLIKHEISNFKSWLHSVTRNHCLLILRAESYKTKKLTEIKKDSKIFVENEISLHPIDGDEQEMKLKKLAEGIAELKDEQKICVDLFYLQDKSYNEIAEITGFDLKQVKSYIQNGKRNLKIYLEQSGIAWFIILILENIKL